jgi:hypothetical protein
LLSLCRRGCEGRVLGRLKQAKIRMLIYVSNFCCFFSVNQKRKKCNYQSF